MIEIKPGQIWKKLSTNTLFRVTELPHPDNSDCVGVMKISSKEIDGYFKSRFKGTKEFSSSWGNGIFIPDEVILVEDTLAKYSTEDQSYNQENQ